MAGFLGDDFAEKMVDLMSGGVKDANVPLRTEEVKKAEQEEFYKASASDARALAFERRRRLPYLIQKGLSKPSNISFDVLRRASKSVSIVRICIHVLKEKITKTQWVIQSKDPKKDIDQDQIDEVTNLFMYPNQNNETFRSFLDKILEDLLVLDAVAIEKTRFPDGKLAELHHVDAATIRPIYDEHGQQDILLPFAEKEGKTEMLPVSYVQLIDDNPWGGREAGQPVAFWPKKDFMYFHMHPQGDLNAFGYGLSPIESVIGVVSNILSADNFNATYFEEGAFPPMILQFMAKMGTRELEQLREYMKTELEGRFYRPAILAGSEEIKPIPLKEITQRDMQFSQYMDFMSRLLASAYGLKAQDIGITDGENYATSKTQKELMEQQGYGSILHLLKETFNQQILWKDLGYTDLEFSWVLTDSLDPQTSTQMYDTSLRNGSMTMNDVRKRQGLLPYGEWADVPAILGPEGYIPIVPVEDMEEDMEDTTDNKEDKVRGQTIYEDESTGEEAEQEESNTMADLEHDETVSKSVITNDGDFLCRVDDRGVGQPFIFSGVLDGKGFAIKPPIAVNLYSQKLEEKWTHKLHDEGLPVVRVSRMSLKDIWKDIIPNNQVRKEFESYQNMEPAYDSEKWKHKYGNSRKFPYYMVSEFIDGKSLIDPLLIADMKRVPGEYVGAIKQLAKLWLAEKKYVLGDRRADQVLITPDKKLAAFDFQFVGNKGRWNGTKNAYANALKQIPELHDLFLKLTGQDVKTKVKKFLGFN